MSNATEKQSLISKLKSKPISKCEKEWMIEISPDAVREEENQFYNSIHAHAEVPGFRKGKAPRQVLELHFKDRAKDEIVKHLVSRAVREGMTSEKEDLIHFPQVKDIHFENSTLSFKVVIEIRPQMKLCKYQSLKVKRGTAELSETEIEQMLTQLRERTATFRVVDGRGVEMGDFVQGDFALVVDGKEVERRAGEMFEISKDEFLPRFAEQVVGLKVGETRDISTELPKTFPNKEWAGKPAIFRLTAKEIKNKTLPEVNDEWAASLGQFKSCLELRTHIREDLLKRKQNDVEYEFERAILDALISQTKFDVPAGSVNRRLAYLKHQNTHKLMSYGYTEDKAAQASLEKENELKQEAERQVRVSFILDEIAKQEKIVMDDKAIENRIEELARQTNQPVDKVQEHYMDDDRRDSLREQMKYEKVIEILKGMTKAN